MEIVNYPWSEILIGSSIVLGTTLGLLLTINKYPASRWLGGLCLTYVGLILVKVFGQTEWSLAMTIPFSAVLFFYSHSFFLQRRRLDWRLVVPVSLAVVLVVLPMLSPLTSQMLSALVSLGYLIFTNRFLRSEGQKRGILWFVNPGARLIWFRNFMVINQSFLLVWFISPSLPIWSLSLIILFLLGYVFYQIFDESSFLSPIPLANKYQKSTLTPAIKASILEKLNRIFEEEKFHLNDDASLSTLAQALGATTHHLSQVLNESKKISFQELIAQYRVREAMKLLKEPSAQDTKIENIAVMVGYNSKSAFNTAFKKRTGHTPSEFRAQKHVLTYREERLPEREGTYISNKRFDLNHSFSSITKTDMIQNFFKSFARNIRRNKLFTAINLFGLTLAFLCSLFIYLFLVHELSYDQDVADHDQIYRIAWINENPQTRTPHPMAQAMVNDWPEVEQAVSISPWYDAGLNREKILVENQAKDVKFEERDFFFADSTFFDVFGIEVLEGDAEALSQPFTLVITDVMAKKYFGDESAIGQELRISDMPIVVSTVVRALPENTHFHFQALLSYMTLKTINPEDNWLTWDDFGHFNYVKLKEDANPELLEGKLASWIINYHDWSEDDKEIILGGDVYFDLQPIADIHLQSNLRWELENNGNMLHVYILTGTLIFLLLIAGINYVNLTTAKSLERAKEIGVRKTLGAFTRSLSIQFYFESVIFCFAASIMAFVLAVPGLELFNDLSGQSFQLSDLFHLQFVGVSLAVILGIGLLAGAYPATVLSSFKPAEVLKGKLTTSAKGIATRGVLVTLQFTISAILIAGSLIIVRQVDYMKSKELGFDQDAVVHLPIPVSVEVGGTDLNKLILMQKRLKELLGILAVSASSNIPGSQFNQHPIYPVSNPENRVDASEMMQDFGLKEVLNYKLVAGRDFDRSYAIDTVGTNFIINEAAAAAMNLENPIGQKMVWVDNDRNVEGTVIGVVKDFHYRSLHETIQPLIIQLQAHHASHFILKLEGKALASTLADVESLYTQTYPNNPFSYHFLDHELADLYSQEQKTLSIFTVFAGVALVLACLGLLGMAFTMLNQRVKEIGMRKIMGASAFQIALLVLGQFARLLIVAMIIGLPVAYFLMENWMMEFSFRAPSSALPFVLAALILLVISILSVSGAVAKMAFSKPIDSLRYE